VGPFLGRCAPRKHLLMSVPLIPSRWIIEGADKGLERGKVEAWIGPQLVHKRTKK
jgi:hypothetical protein